MIIINQSLACSFEKMPHHDHYHDPLVNDQPSIGTIMILHSSSIPIKTKARSVWRYSLADWDKACELIEATDWMSLLDHLDVDRSWSNWKNAFLTIMEECIPKATLPPKRNQPWLTTKLIQAIKRIKNAIAEKIYT